MRKKPKRQDVLQKRIPVASQQGTPVSNTDRYIEGTDDLTMIRVVKHKNDRSMSNIKDKSH